MATIQVKRGAAAGLPTLASGEPGWTTDTNVLYVGTGAGNILIGPGAGLTSPLTTKGDVWVYTTADARLPVGANGYVLTADSAEASGLKWATPAAGYTDEEAQDAVGTILTDSSTIDFSYNDGTPSITADVKDGSVTYAKIQDVSATARLLGRYSTGAGDVEELRLGTGLALNTDLLYVTGTFYTDELAQDAVGLILSDSTTIDFTYNDGTPQITAGVINNSIGTTQMRDLRLAQGRLTLTSGTPVTTADVTGATTLYYTPHVGNLVSLYDGSKWVPQTFSELSLDLTAGGGLTGSKPHDVFLRLVAGTPTLSAVEWTNATTRNTALARQDGTWVKDGATGWLYLGTIYTTAGSQTEDSEARRCVWNAYNRVLRPLRVTDATDSWNYTTATWRQARGSSANQVDYVCGLSEDPVRATVQARMSNSTGTTASAGVGVDSTSTNSARLHGAGATGVAQTTTAFYQGYPGVGYHYLAWLEISGAVGTTVWYGDNGLTYWGHGMSAEVLA